MRKLFLYLITVLSYPFLSLNAEMCDDCCCGWGNIGVEAEWLYFKPSINTAFIQARFATTTAPVVESILVDPRYHSGWRLGLNYQFCNCVDTISVRWTQFRARDHRQTTGADAFITPVTVFTGSIANDDLKFSYYALESLWKHKLFCDRCFETRLLFGVQYAWLGINERTNIPITTFSNNAKMIAHFWGVGPELGLDFNYHILKCLSLTGRGTYSLLVSEIHTKIQTLFNNLVAELRTRPFWSVVPTWDLRLGVRYDGSFCCFDVFIEGGYEVITYSRGLRVVDVTFGAAAYSYTNANMHGPYVAAGILF